MPRVVEPRQRLVEDLWTSYQLRERLSDSIGVPTVLVKTIPESYQRGPAASRSSACATLWARSA